MRRGILGGTFDPPHLGHLIAGEAAYRQLELDVVSFIPAGAPWQKATKVVTAAQHRWAMVLLAVEGIAYFEADDREIVRDGWTYAADTLDEFSDDDIVLVLGADAAARLPTWHRADEVLARVTVAAAPRPGTSRAAVAEAGVTAEWLDMPEVDVSGSALREWSGSGNSIRFFVREAVYAYIQENALYGP